MRVLWFMPLTFLAGIHGFGLFVPYLLIVSAVASVAQHAKARSRTRAPREPIAVPEILEFEPSPA